MPNSRWLRKARLSPLSLLLLPLALHGASARAQPGDVAPPEPALRMTWESDDPSCSGDEVTTRALRLVSPGVVPRPLRAQVQVRREGEQWFVRLQTESGELSGRRMLRAESCREIQQAIALLLAMAMESKGDVVPPETAPEAPPTASAPEPAAVAPPPAPAPAAPEIHDTAKAVEPPERQGIGIGVFARLDGKAALGLMPGLGLGVGIAVGVRLGDVDLGLSGAFWPETQAQVLDRPGRVSVARQNVGLRGCWNAWREGDWVLAPCLAPELTYFRYVSDGVAQTERGRAGPLVSLTGAVDLRYELIGGRLSLLLSPGLTGERRQPFQIRLNDGPSATGASTATETVEVYKTTGIAPRLEVGVDARF